MKYKKYPQYKDSGVDWLGKIPSDWDVARVKNSSKIFNGATPKSGTTEYWDGDISWIGPADMGKISSRYISGGARNITYSGYDSCGTTIIPEGSVILSSRAPIGKVAIAGKELCTNQGCKSLIVNKYFSNIFIFYILTSNTVQLNLLGRGTTFLELSAEELSSFNIPIPSLEEQQAIANYLDSATAKIDILIEKQTKLIALLKEKRQAVISTAVTRGLDNTVAMKDSEVEWLGEIPEHWTRTPLRYIGRLQNGISKGGDYFGSGYPFVNYGDIYKNATLPQQVSGLAKSTKEDQHIYSVKTGDVFFTRTSETIDDIGMASTCIKTIKKGTFSGFTIRFRQLSQTLNEHFSKYYFRTGHAQAFFEEQLNLVTRASLGQDILKQLPVLLPPLDEQQVIANYLDDKISKIDILITKATKAIELLKEKRTALINSAVTGKIDVRESE